MWASIISGVSRLVTGYQTNKSKKNEQKFELERLDHEARVGSANAVLELAKQGKMQDFNLDKIAMQNMKSSLKDELVLIIFLMPLVLAFIPSMAVHVERGFKVISEMPQWYVAIIIGMVVVIYGMRGLLRAYLDKSSLKKA